MFFGYEWRAIHTIYNCAGATYSVAYYIHVCFMHIAILYCAYAGSENDCTLVYKLQIIDKIMHVIDNKKTWCFVVDSATYYPRSRLICKICNLFWTNQTAA